MSETLSGGAAAGGAGEGRWRRFWRRQAGFEQGERPRGSGPVVWDLMFGVALPVVCFVFDPIVFRGYGRLERLQFFAYVFSGLEMAVLLFWLACGRRAGEWGGVVGGVLLAGAFFSFVVGLAIFPLSLIGLIFVIGALGFTPFFTAGVYLRNGLYAVRSCGRRRASTAAGLLCGMLFAFTTPSVAGTWLERAAEATLVAALEGRPAPPVAAQASAWAAALTQSKFDRFVWAYRDERDPERRARLAAAYRELTGQDIERRLARLLD